MASRALAFTLFTVLAFAAFAQADCVRAKPPEGTNSVFLTVDSTSGIGQATVSIYLEKKGGTKSCTMTTVLAQESSAYSISITPEELKHAGTYYGVYPITITATAPATAASETVTLRFIDSDTGVELGTVPVLLGIGQSDSSNVPGIKPHNCTKEDTSGCSEKELIALEMGPTFIEQNVSDFYLLVGIIAAFAMIVLIFFVIIPRK